jgi:RND family efflux transporter MFP subunit
MWQQTCKNICIVSVSLCYCFTNCHKEDKNKIPPVLDQVSVTKQTLEDVNRNLPVSTPKIPTDTPNTSGLAIPGDTDLHQDTLSEDDNHTFTGTVDSDGVAKISGKTGGTVDKILVRIGSKVRAGQVLAVLDTQDATDQAKSSKLQVQQAQIQLNQATKNKTRQKSVWEHKLISNEEWERIQDACSTAQANYQIAVNNNRMAQRRQTDGTVKAPFAGIVQDRFVNKGDLLSPGAPIVSLVNTDQQKQMIFAMPEESFDYIRRGSILTIQSPKRLAGQTIRIVETIPALQAQNKTFTVVGVMTNSSNNKNLLMGQSVVASWESTSTSSTNTHTL